MNPTKATLVLGITYAHKSKNELVSITGFVELLSNNHWVAGVSYIKIDEGVITYVRDFEDFVKNYRIVRKKGKYETAKSAIY